MPDVLKIARGFELPLDLVTEATAIVATRGAGKSSASAVIVEEAFALGVQSVTFDRTGVYWGLRSNKAGNGAGLPIYVLGGPHGDLPLEPHAGVLIADLVVDHSEHSFVLDLSDFSKSGAIKFAADFLERLYDRKARARTTTLVVMDEAHFYAPQTPRGGFKGDAARLMGAMEDMVGLGRSRGLGVVLTTQRTQSLNKAVLDLIETLLVMRMLSPRARDAVQDWIREKHEDDREGVIETLESLPTGTAWIWSPLRGILRKVALRRIKTFDSYDTPKPGQARVEPTARKELDLSALGEQMQATAERAKENDPAELRKQVRTANERIRVLDEMVEAFQREGARVEEVEVEKVVEVPVFTDEDRAWLKHIAGAYEGIGSQLEVVGEEAGKKLDALIAKANAVSVPVEQAKKSAPPPVRREPPAPPPPSPRSSVASPSLEGGVLPVSEQKVLDAVAWFEALSVTTPTKQQVGIVAGYKVGKSVGGRYANLLGALRNENGKYEWPSLIYYPGGNVALTEEGRALANDQSLPHDNAAVHEQVLARLDPSEGKVLRALIRHWPHEVPREELAVETGYDPNGAKGGRFANLLGALRTLALIDYPSPGHVVALDVLFPVR